MYSAILQCDLGRGLESASDPFSCLLRLHSYFVITILIIKCSNNLYLDKFGGAHQGEVNGELHVRMAATQTLIPLHLLTRPSHWTPTHLEKMLEFCKVIVLH